MTQIFAHRGFSAAYPENTMKAFIEAEKAGADGIELDVQLTKDQELVVIHDEKVDRTTNGSGYVKDFTLKELRKLDTSFSRKIFAKKGPIPTLQEVFEWLSNNRMICNVELKNNRLPYEGMEEKVIDMIRRFQLTDRIVISSFNHYSIVYSYRIDPTIETAPLFSERLYMPWVYANSIRSKGIHPKYLSLTDEIIVESIKNGIAVRPYTVNKDADMRRLFALNCSAIITDDPVKALRIKQQYRFS
ncbi:glycerophosphodiester phosphodiesterase [Bacillus sp. 03113]|uniref:glycerophosphodiester phosphodiesterase n=1 Tax=Bacillus sp. 03113 TaxID=2578211 RepID=UPI0011423DE9|nr:glycerophosphodiester phosphodiesterase [Bacillus sp. 03113]